MNKYEENISDIITFDAIEEIVDIFLEHATDTDDNVGLIANKELIEYAMSEALSQDWINVRKVNLELDDIEYMISIDIDGNLVVQPIIEYTDKYFSTMEYVYISMDGDVDQTTIDNCLNRDVDVVLFGYEDDSDEEHDYIVNREHVDKATFDEYVSKFAPDKVKKSEDNDDNDSSTYNIIIKGNLDMGDAEKIIEDMERRMAHMQEMIDDMNPFRRLFMW